MSQSKTAAPAASSLAAAAVAAAPPAAPGDETTTLPPSQAAAAAPASPPVSAAAEVAAAPAVSAEALAAAAKAERERVLGIQAAAFPGQEALAKEMIESGASVGDAALAFNKAEKQAQASNLDGIRSVETATGRVPTAPSAAGTEVPGKPAADAVGGTEEDWRAQYKASAEIRDEFGSEDAYVGFKSAEASGRVKVMGKSRRAA